MRDSPSAAASTRLRRSPCCSRLSQWSLQASPFASSTRISTASSLANLLRSSMSSETHLLVHVHGSTLWLRALRLPVTKLLRRDPTHLAVCCAPLTFSLLAPFLPFLFWLLRLPPPGEWRGSFRCWNCLSATSTRRWRTGIAKERTQLPVRLSLAMIHPAPSLARQVLPQARL